MTARERFLRFLLDSDTHRRMMDYCYRFTISDLDILAWAAAYQPKGAENIVTAENKATDDPNLRQQANSYIAAAMAWLREQKETWDRAGDVLFAFERQDGRKSLIGRTETNDSASGNAQTRPKPQNALALQPKRQRRSVRKVTDSEPMLIGG